MDAFLTRTAPGATVLSFAMMLTRLFDRADAVIGALTTWLSGLRLRDVAWLALTAWCVYSCAFFAWHMLAR